MLQETHFPARYNPKLLHAYYPTIYLVNAANKTKGVEILISKHSKFSPTSEYKDLECRFIIVKGIVEGKLYSLISYYTPNKGQSKFFQTLFKTLNPLLEGSVIFGGDSSLAFDQGLDKSKPPASQLT